LLGLTGDFTPLRFGVETPASRSSWPLGGDSTPGVLEACAAVDPELVVGNTAGFLHSLNAIHGHTGGIGLAPITTPSRPFDLGFALGSDEGTAAADPELVVVVTSGVLHLLDAFLRQTGFTCLDLEGGGGGEKSASSGEVHHHWKFDL
jgi:hypothetical protein